MVNSNKKQLLIFLSIIIFMFLIIGIYFFRSYTYKTNYETIESVNILENISNTVDDITNNEIENTVIEESNFSDSDCIIVHITGAVNNPGIVKLPINSRISDAINYARWIYSR